MRRFQWCVFVLSVLFLSMPVEALPEELTLLMNRHSEGEESLAAAEQWNLGCLIGPDTPPLCSLSTVELRIRDDATVLMPKVWRMRRARTGPGQDRHHLVFTGGDQSNVMTLELTSEIASPIRRDITSLRASLVKPDGEVIHHYTVETGVVDRSFPPLRNDGVRLKEFREPAPQSDAEQPAAARDVKHRCAD
jgi:hypothetical protein